jgi:hypothetical protein
MLTFVTPKGLTFPLVGGRKAVVEIIKERRRQGFPVTIITAGSLWCVGEHPDSSELDNNSGFLILK